MLVLRQISRNVTRRPLVQYISTTSIRNDDTSGKDPPSSNEKDKISNKLSDAQLEARKKLKASIEDSVSLDAKTVSQSAEVKDVKNIKRKQTKGRESLQFLFKDEAVQEPQEEVKKKGQEEVQDDVDLEEVIRKAAKEKLDAKKRLANIFKEPKETESLENVIDADKKKDHLKGKQKLEALMQEAESLEVEDKVKLSHPPEKTPVDKMLPKADSKTLHDFLKSIKEVATEIGGNVKATERELISAIFDAVVTEESDKKRTAEPVASIGDVVSDMAVDKTKSRPQDRLRNLFEAQELMQRQRKRFAQREDQSREVESFDLFVNESLGIFDEEYKKEVLLNKSSNQLVLETFSAIEKRELKKLVTHHPKNIYEEMIKWTKEGKLWHFPIDNEWKWDWEANVEFTEHILLEQHLEPWCPSGGPIRHFMELVCVGLGKNPYISAEEKRRHIYWFRDYFEEKRKLLEEIGAFGSGQKKIEQSQ